jgi:hypothetical protein
MCKMPGSAAGSLPPCHHHSQQHQRNSRSEPCRASQLIAKGAAANHMALPAILPVRRLALALAASLPGLLTPVSDLPPADTSPPLTILRI